MTRCMVRQELDEFSALAMANAMAESDILIVSVLYDGYKYSVWGMYEFDDQIAMADKKRCQNREVKPCQNQSNI